jgi:hypothetical protein
MKLDRRRRWLAPAGALIAGAWLAEACVVPEFYIDEGLGGAASGGDTSSGGGDGDGDGGETTESGGTSSGDGGSAAGGSESSGGSASGGGTDSGGSNSSGTGGTCLPAVDLPSPFPDDWTSGTVVQLSYDAAWSWHSSERAVVDVASGKLLASSVAYETGATELVLYNLSGGGKVSYVLGSPGQDDQNSAALVVKAPDEYFAAWAGHELDCNTYFSNFSDTTWSPGDQVNWSTPGFAPKDCPWTTPAAANLRVNHNSVWEMSDEDVYYDIVRAIDGGESLLASNDGGLTWSYAGQLTSQASSYPFGYYSFWGNGQNRIDFIGTEAHPRDEDTSLYHGYLQGGQVYDSLGVSQDADVTDDMASEVTDFIQVFPAGMMLGGVALGHLWNLDLVRYDDGTIAAVWQGRVDGTSGSSTDLRLAYSRFDGTSWASTYLGQAGPYLSDNEQDYTGGAALDPDHPGTIYISTAVDPRDDTTILDHHEIWKGVTCDDGVSFEWTPITMSSMVDNLRPTVPKWDEDHTALLWFRGLYTSPQDFGTELVALISGP